MANEQQTQPQVAIPLPKGKKNAVQIGCICMMLSVAMYGLVFATLTSPILESVNAMGYVSLFSIFAGMGVSIMTPIGGKLGDLIGRRNIVVIPGIICAVCGIAFAFVRSLVPLMILRLLIGFAQGAFTAAPYIIAGLINERKDVPKAMGMLATAIAVGGFGGSIIAGILTDMGLLKVAILMPAVPLILGVVLIGMNMPNVKREGKVSIDIPGIIALVVALAGILLAVMGFTTPSTSIIIYFVALTITGIAESYRSVSITPSAQATLQPADMGVGTSLVNFVNSLANTIAAAVFGAAYNLNTAADPTNVAYIRNGVDSVFRLAAIVAVIGLVLVIFVVRPKMTAKKAE